MHELQTNVCEWLSRLWVAMYMLFAQSFAFESYSLNKNVEFTSSNKNVQDLIECPKQALIMWLDCFDTRLSKEKKKLVHKLTDNFMFSLIQPIW